MKKLLFFTLLGSLFFGQQQEGSLILLDKYPEKQKFYEGGTSQLYSDIHKTIVDQKIEPCENKSEIYMMKFIVYPDATIKFIKEEDPEKTQKNKCAFDLTRKVFKHLKNWKPAEISGQKFPAIVRLLIFPDDLFDKYAEGYTGKQYWVDAEFPGGLDAFRKEYIRNVDIGRFSINQTFKLTLHFTVNEQGEAVNFRLGQTSGNDSFDDVVMKSAKWIKKKWKPATFHGISIESYFTFPITFNDY
ncbi:hypothetical protein BAX95_15280 [Elizabethkingia meningoseptica]|nr:hypothetical protein BAX95_15280 [Elizabethkingia meningoseptica]